MHHSLDEFMAEVLNKYKGFLVQCEVFWIDSCKEYLDTLQKFRKYEKVYLRSCQSMFYRNCEVDFQETLDDIAHGIKEEKKNMGKGNKEMFDKLKVLHGHPNNKHLLRELEEQYKTIFAEYEAKYSKIMDSYKKQLKEKIVSIKQYFENMVVKFGAVGAEDKLSDMIDTLQESYKMKISSIHDFKYGATETGTFSKTILKYLTKFEGLAAIKSDVISSTATSESSTVEDPETMFMNLEKNGELELEKIAQVVESDLLEYLRNYDKMWSTEIDCIRNLFVVKYDRHNSV
ncbi:unnamed protein product [Acanthoscelides obtectus]|nr:unnamed protein product [Acanthoscelides obtectus]CAK1625314.1 hypothetical protein AOBTE_LOCUS3102 [Acanthoscelides obtectus]